MSANTQPRSGLDAQLSRFERHTPRRMSGFIRWIRQPSSVWLRWPLALLLVGAGFVGFLPVLGFWMLPLGLVLIAQDIPPLRSPIARLAAWGLDKWEARRRAQT
jgi:hypothetical protein